MATLKTTRQIRHENFKRLLEEHMDSVWKQFPDEPMKGMLASFAARCNESPAYLSHVKNDRKAVGTALARSLEQSMGKPVGWMDNDHGGEAPASMSEKEFLESWRALHRQTPDEATQALLRFVRERLSAVNGETGDVPQSDD